jgi:hypothetical protein
MTTCTPGVEPIGAGDRVFNGGMPRADQEGKSMIS